MVGHPPLPPDQTGTVSYSSYQHQSQVLSYTGGGSLTCQPGSSTNTRPTMRPILFAIRRGTAVLTGVSILVELFRGFDSMNLETSKSILVYGT